MANFEVTCTIRSTSAYQIRERITHLGIATGKGTETYSETQVIVWIESKAHSFFVSKEGKQVAVIIATRDGRKYLKTTSDGIEPNNLLSLPRCW